MIKVLQDESEIVEATQWLREISLLPHTEKSKNFDLAIIHELLEPAPKNISVVDLGCGPSKYGCVTLNSLAKAGFKNLMGIDIYLPWYIWFANFIAFVRFGIWRNQYKLKQGDICLTDLPSASIDFAILLSVIEHGVSLEDLMKELARIVRPEGKVYISTDYWPSNTIVSQRVVAASRFNAPMLWRVFNTEDINMLIEIAKNVGLELYTPMDIPPVKDKVISWHGYGYTFISLVLKKT